MKVYDISQEVFNCNVYPGDPEPELIALNRMSQGDLYNLSAFKMCAHNGTHVDAPFHFVQDGKTVEQLSLEALVGWACVMEHEGCVSASDAAKMIEKAKTFGEEGWRRMLIKGKAEVGEEAAKVFTDAGILLLGVESQTVGPEEAPMATHLILLKSEVVILEGVQLNEVVEGKYLLSAAPINLGGLDGAPCRAVLIDLG